MGVNRRDISASRKRSAVGEIVILRETPYLDGRRIQRVSKNGQGNEGVCLSDLKASLGVRRISKMGIAQIAHILSLKTTHSPGETCCTMCSDICCVAREPEEPTVF